LSVQKSIVSFEPFKAIELMGWGYGIIKQAVFTLPAGSTVELSLTVPKNEVWWITFGIFDGMPSDTVFHTFKTDRESHEPLLLTEGFISQPICPAGWHRADEFVTETLQNVTGNTDYNTLPSQDLNVRINLFVFKVEKQWVTKLEGLLETLLGEQIITKSRKVS